MQVSPGGHKKKIIAVGSDFESSPSPEETPSPTTSPRDLFKNQKGNPAINVTPTGKPATKSQSFNNGVKADELKDENHNSSERLSISGKHKKLMGNKWKNSISKLPF